MNTVPAQTNIVPTNFDSSKPAPSGSEESIKDLAVTSSIPNDNSPFAKVESIQNGDERVTGLDNEDDKAEFEDGEIIN